MKNPIDEAHDYVNELEAEVKQLKELLRRVQWDREYTCPICEQSFEHAADCELAKELD